MQRKEGHTHTQKVPPHTCVAPCVTPAPRTRAAWPRPLATSAPSPRRSAPGPRRSPPRAMSKKGGDAPTTTMEKYTILKDQPVRKTSKGKSDQSGIVKKGQIVVVEVRHRCPGCATRRRPARPLAAEVFYTLSRNLG